MNYFAVIYEQGKELARCRVHEEINAYRFICTEGTWRPDRWEIVDETGEALFECNFTTPEEKKMLFSGDYIEVTFEHDLSVVNIALGES